MFMREDGQMGTCRICGKNFGLMGGGSEPYTGHNLQVCNSCGEVLKKIDKVKNEDTQEVKDLFVSVMSMTDDADVKQILTDYSKSVISDSEKLVAITNESKEKAERAQNIEENFYDLEKAFKVTTGYDFEGYQIVDYPINNDGVVGNIGIINQKGNKIDEHELIKAIGVPENVFVGNNGRVNIACASGLGYPVEYITKLGKSAVEEQKKRMKKRESLSTLDDLGMDNIEVPEIPKKKIPGKRKQITWDFINSL